MSANNFPFITGEVLYNLVIDSESEKSTNLKLGQYR